jgi:hypothetical protein
LYIHIDPSISNYILVPTVNLLVAKERLYGVKELARALTTTTIPVMAKKQTRAGQGQPPKNKPNRKPSHDLFVRLDKPLGEAFVDHVKGLRPRTSTTAVVEMLIEQYLSSRGLWPPSALPGSGATP